MLENLMHAFRELPSHILGHFAWWLFGLLCISLIVMQRKAVLQLRTLLRISHAGITRIIFARSHYDERLPEYLSKAQQSIRIISISLKQPHDEGRLVDLFRRKLALNPSFEIFISLVKPNSAAADLAAKSLDVPVSVLNTEIQSMLDELASFRRHLPEGDRKRFHLCTHECLPMGSAILLDASASSGKIQVETKLYRTPRVSSFGYEITAPSEFFAHNFEAWCRIARDGTPVD